MNLKKGEKWYVRLPNGSTLVDVTVQDFTVETVLLKEHRKWACPVRYKRDDIEFVEPH
jgi:hypothetical protein